MHNQKNAQNLHIEFKMADLLSEGYGFRAFFFFLKKTILGAFLVLNDRIVRSVKGEEISLYQFLYM